LVFESQEKNCNLSRALQRNKALVELKAAPETFQRLKPSSLHVLIAALKALRDTKAKGAEQCDTKTSCFIS